MSAVVYKYKKTGKYSYDHLFVKRKEYVVNSTNAGLMDMPTDYTEALTVYVLNNGILTEGTIYSWDEFLEIQNSNILAPTLSYPAATIYVAETGTAKIQFKPTPLSAGTNYTFTLVYMRKPANGVYKYTVSGTTGTIAYVDSGSVNLDIDDRYFSDILTRALMYLGISLGDANTASTEQLKDNNQKVDER
jgi:hypothetical protein